MTSRPAFFIKDNASAGRKYFLKPSFIVSRRTTVENSGSRRPSLTEYINAAFAPGFVMMGSENSKYHILGLIQKWMRLNMILKERRTISHAESRVFRVCSFCFALIIFASRLNCIRNLIRYILLSPVCEIAPNKFRQTSSQYLQSDSFPIIHLEK